MATWAICFKFCSPGQRRNWLSMGPGAIKGLVWAHVGQILKHIAHVAMRSYSITKTDCHGSHGFLLDPMPKFRSCCHNKSGISLTMMSYKFLSIICNFHTKITQ